MRNKTEKTKTGAEGEDWEITADNNKRGPGNRKKGRPSFASESGLGAGTTGTGCFRKMAAREGGGDPERAGNKPTPDKKNGMSECC